MPRRPLSIAVIAWLFIAVGACGLAFLLWPFVAPDSARRMAGLEVPRPDELWPIAISEAVALVSGAFMLRGANWARWLLVAWMVFHVGLSFLHSPVKVLTHLVLFSAIGWFLFRPKAASYFS